MASVLGMGCSKDGAIPNVPSYSNPPQICGQHLARSSWKHTLVPDLRSSSEVQEEKETPDDKSVNCSQIPIVTAEFDGRKERRGAGRACSGRVGRRGGSPVPG